MDLDKITMITHIDTNTEAGQQILAEMLVDAILNEPQEELEPPYKRNDKAFIDYVNVIGILVALKKEGILDFTYDNFDKPYICHFVYIKWKVRDDNIVETDTKKVVEILSHFENLLIDMTEPSEWQLSSELYESVNEVE